MKIGRTNASAGGQSTDNHLTEYEKWYNGFGLDFDAVQLDYKNNPLNPLFPYPFIVVYEYEDGEPMYAYDYTAEDIRVNGSRLITQNGDYYIQPSELINNSYDNKMYFYVMYCMADRRNPSNPPIMYTSYSNNVNNSNRQVHKKVIFHARHVIIQGYINNATHFGAYLKGLYLGDLNYGDGFNWSTSGAEVMWIESSKIMPSYYQLLNSVEYKSIKKSFDLGCYIQNPLIVYPCVSNWTTEEQEWYFNVFQPLAYERYLFLYPDKVRVVSGAAPFGNNTYSCKYITPMENFNYTQFVVPSYTTCKINRVVNLNVTTESYFNMNFFNIYNNQWEEFPRFNNIPKIVTNTIYRRPIISSWIIDMGTFAKFDENDNIIDGFITDLVTETVNGASITFDPTNPKVILNAKAGYTPTQITLIEQYLTAKNYAISW